MYMDEGKRDEGKRDEGKRNEGRGSPTYQVHVYQYIKQYVLTDFTIFYFIT